MTIALDSSGSVGIGGWAKLQEFTKNILSAFEISPDCTKVAIIAFGNTCYIESYLTSDLEEVLEAIDSMPFRDQWTNTGACFQTMKNSIFQSSMGDRENAVNMGARSAAWPARAALGALGKGGSGPG